MFEQFTDRARQAVVLAQQEARRINHGYIGTEHLLLGLLREGEGGEGKRLESLGIPPDDRHPEREGLAAEMLESLGVSPDHVRQQIREIIGRGDEPPPGHIPFTPRARTALELSEREGRRLGHHHIGTGHLLLGLVREREGVAAQVLMRHGADLATVRTEVSHRASGDVPPLRRRVRRLADRLPFRRPRAAR